MKHLGFGILALILAGLLLGSPLSTPAQQSNTSAAGTKLLVIGISKYKNHPPLQYADRDACLFYNYMIDTNGGNVKVENSQLLLNEQATAAGIYSALDNILENVREGDAVYVYFSGYSDSEQDLKSQEGFLLACDAPKTAYLTGGTVGFTYLKLYLESIAERTKAQLFFIADAGQAGLIQGDSNDVTTNLSTQWENITKILSCQAGELGYEGKQWNNGQGVFTYYLIKAMCGLADLNADGIVNLLELNVYLNENIPKETNFKQNPMLIGNQQCVISKSNVKLLESIFNKCP
jgi:uncharacterized caspase-like protein